MSEKRNSILSWDWLVQMYTDSGLDQGVAGASAERTWRRLVTRTHRAKSRSKKEKQDIRGAMVADPMVSFHRITGTGVSGLPFYDEEKNALNPVEFAFAMRDAGLSPEVALAFAKVVVELIDAPAFFEPVWRALGRDGPVDLDELGQMDWSPLRDGVDLAIQEGGESHRRERSKPHLHRPLLTRNATGPVFRSPEPTED